MEAGQGFKLIMIKFNNVCIRICQTFEIQQPIDLVYLEGSTEKVKIRPRNTRPLLIIEEIVSTSILPPLTMATAFLPLQSNFF